jgi:hypothetical protein
MRRPLLALALAACSPGGSDDATGGGSESGGSTGEPTPQPEFLNPAVGSFAVLATQTAPEVLQVERVLPGNTQVLLDGDSLGTLGPGNKFGALTEDTLTLTLHGGLTVGSHTVQLVTAGAEGPLYSTELTMQVESAKGATPTWTHALAPEVVAAGSALVAGGVGAGGVLGVVGPGDPDPALRLFLADGDGWATAGPEIVVPLAGHVLEDMSWGPAVGAAAFPEPGGGAPRRARAVYRVGLPGQAVASRDIVINPDPIVLDPVTVFDRDAALAGEQVEWAALGRPLALGHTLLAELTAAADAEVPHPGDRRLVASFWRGDELGWTAPQRLGTAAPTDLDALGPSPVLADLPGDLAATLSVRLGGAFPALLEVRDNGAVAISGTGVPLPLGLAGDVALATVVGGYGSRTVLAADRRGRVRVALTTLGPAGLHAVRAPRASDLPDLAPSAAPAPGVGSGYPFFLLPYGDAAPVHLVYSDGEALGVRALEDPSPLHCDAVALAATLAGNDPEAPGLGLACLSRGELRVGRLRVAPPA